MKKFLTSIVLLVSIFCAKEASAQTTYNVTSNTTYSKANIPTLCINCNINIADGVTLTVDKDIYLMNVSFSGGATSKSTLLVNDNRVTIWAATTFTNIIGTFSNGASLVNAASMSFTSSVFTFSQTSFATVYTSVALVSSNWKFIGNAYMESTGGVFSLKAGSISAGDGTLASRANVRFNGGTLSLLDAVSFVTVANNNNYYFNWSNYNGNGTSIQTTNNNINCGSGKNACSAPLVYGPASLTSSGVVSSAMLPVKLIAFVAKADGNNVTLNWITSQEINSEVFEIESSTDGLHWTTVGSVAAKGNASTYSYSDVTKLNGSISYRLKMVDQDKNFEYSVIRSVKVNGVQSATIKTYPNPATEYFMIDVKGQSNLQVQIISLNGATVKSISAYSSNAKIFLSDVRNGNYAVKVTNANGVSQVSKLVVAH
jgi:hypothetical protein